MRIPFFAGFIVVATSVAQAQMSPAPAPSTMSTAARPALTVTVTRAQRSELISTLAANGNIAAWQEAIVGTETNGLRLVEVNANVGDVVRKGQLLARLNSDMLAADLAQIRANVVEAEAALAEAKANADRARSLEPKGMITGQQAAQWLTAEKSAGARLTAQRARIKAEEVRLAQTRVVAPDDGVISARNATIGAVPSAGQELFRLIRQQRLEWRAEVTASELNHIAPKQKVRVILGNAGGVAIDGTVRMIAPTVDAQTRNALVFVDLPASAAQQGARPGLFAKGEFALGTGSALTVPASAVLMRDGFAFVFAVQNNKVVQTKVQIGQRSGAGSAERIEIAGLAAEANVVANGVGFLNDGDTVRVVSAAPSVATPPAVADKK